ncbi:acyltransferase family protein [Nocardiopsis mangrovi]|uniref:Acyltransferase family protein n=1 Tax=Nocardiopsis mangrovi TaxID=1179818 RepID=A0ABV9DXC5_9ACTN
MRAVAVLLVAAYHIWFGRVSGGVDVFLLLTGFLITGSLLRGVERDGRVRPVAFVTRMIRRLSPAAGAVLAAVLAGSWLVLPRPEWRGTIAEVVASALYYQNWRLAAHSVDYLAREGASAVQHFWSLAVQGQFYLVWPLLVGAAALAARRTGLPLRPVLAAALAAVFAGSLWYSVSVTASDPEWAYFDSGARMWEPALGGLVALLPRRPFLPAGVRAVLGWAGLVALAGCGVLVGGSAAFPGYAALWPTGAAVLVILAGTTGLPWGADRLLSWSPLGRVGDLAYPLYLWHWPLLVFHLEMTEQATAGPLGGLVVLGAAAALAWATARLADGGALRLAPARPSPGTALAVGAVFLTPALVLAGCWLSDLDRQRAAGDRVADDRGLYPGAGAVADPRVTETLPDLPVYPDLSDPRDMWLTHVNGCNSEIEGSDVTVCAYGPASAEHSIALVGNSHVGQWFPAMEAIAEANGWRLFVMTKNSCRFGSGVQYLGGTAYTDCGVWNDNAMAELAELRPDAVFTTSTTTGADAPEEVPEGSVGRWRELADMGIDVVAIRDTPRLSFDAPECVDRHGAAGCVERSSYSMAAESPVRSLEGAPGNVDFIDMTGYLCPGGRCPVVVGNVLVMSDDNHLTATYSRTLAPLLNAQVRAATGW